MPPIFERIVRTASRLGVEGAVILIGCYQGICRPLLIGACKFCPSCSEYCIEALRAHGLRKGCWLALGRLLRCHPFGPGGIDPVPLPSGHSSAPPLVSD